MTVAVKLLCRVVKRRLNGGETMSDILADYPKLTEAEKNQVMEKCR